MSPSGFRIDNQTADFSFSTDTLAPLASAFFIGLSVSLFYKKATF